MTRALLRHPIDFARDHRFTRAHASEHLDGELDPTGHARIVEHTSICPPCRRLVESLRRTVQGLRALGARPRDGVAARVIERLREEP